PVQLSRQLAGRGYKVLHLYAGYNVTPRGLLAEQDDDPGTFSIHPIYIRKPLNKYNFYKRWLQEREYGQLLANEIVTFRPDVVISANTPLDAQKQALKATRIIKGKFLFWLQDIIGIATQRLLTKRLPILGSLIGAYYIRLEKELLRSSDHVVPITEDFVPLMRQWGIKESQITVIPNWATLNDLAVQSKDNPWSRSNELTEKFCFLYSGTLGMKHNPDMLLQLALHFRKASNVRIVVVSEGPGADWLIMQREIHKLDNCKIFKYQPFEQLPNVMGTADVLIALLDPDAGVYSVPSKVLTYLCAQRPLLLAVPMENLASRIVKENDAGLVVDPSDISKFIANAKILLNDNAMRARLGQNGRKYAKNNFNINKISGKFESIIDKF
nr:glycosyltransferase family 4 protein [Candidatus Saccharibacteria bacterium]NIP39873.1 glycosyltransferase family 4 protein [Candidatus Dadabacteria bacterium]NIW78208.1 glycosyltransferase [Calditrichia bacterium]NIY23240.1 glycosyltransferase [Candidatus Dadabacteria bacterium]